MRTEAEYRLETAAEALRLRVDELVGMFENLDPFIATEARLKLAQIEGILMFMEEQGNDN